MKMKKSLLSVVFLLATSSAMAAMSFSTASVESDMNVSLVDTQGALLALEASSEHAASGYNDTSADTLNLNLNKGNGTGVFGVQEKSVYTWDDLFKVTNNSEHAVNVSIGTNPNEGGAIGIFSKTDETPWVKMLNKHSPGAKLTFTLQAGDSKWIDIKTVAANGHTVDTALKLIVEAEKVQPSTPAVN